MYTWIHPSVPQGYKQTTCISTILHKTYFTVAHANINIKTGKNLSVTSLLELTGWYGYVWVNIIVECSLVQIIAVD